MTGADAGSDPFTRLSGAKLDRIVLMKCKRIGFKNSALQYQVDLPAGLLGKADIPLELARITRSDYRIVIPTISKLANTLNRALAIANFRLNYRHLGTELFAPGPVYGVIGDIVGRGRCRHIREHRRVPDHT